MDYIQLFFRFLKYHNAYNDYITILSSVGTERSVQLLNLLRLRKAQKSKGKPIVDIDCEYGYENLIRLPFKWSDTRQGEMYWWALHNQWLKVLDRAETSTNDGKNLQDIIVEINKRVIIVNKLLKYSQIIVVTITIMSLLLILFGFLLGYILQTTSILINIGGYLLASSILSLIILHYRLYMNVYGK